MSRIGATVFAAALSFALAARAQEQKPLTEAQRQEAREHLAKAKVHYDLGEFEKAAEEYILVYRISPVPQVLFNIGQSFRQAGQHDKARQFYRSFLRGNPDRKTRAQVEKAIAEIDELLAKEQRTRASPPNGLREPPDVAHKGQVSSQPGPGSAPASTASAPSAPAHDEMRSTVAPSMQPKAPNTALPTVVATPAAPAATSGGTRKTVMYAFAGGSVALLGAGAIFAIKAKNIDTELQARPHATAAVDDLLASSKSAHLISGILLAAGLASGIGAGTLYFLPGPNGAAVGGSF